MARKKKAEVQPEETLEDIVRQEAAEEAAAKETPTEEPTPEPPDTNTPPEETPTEEPQPKPEESKEEPPPAPDPKEIADQVKKEVEEKLRSAFGLTPEEQEQAREEGYQPPWEKRGDAQPADWHEVMEAGAELAEWRRAQKEKADEEARQESQKAEEERTKQLNEYWDDQLADLRKTGKIPAIANPDDPTDPGRVAQRELFETMYQVSQTRQQEGKPTVNNLKEIYYEHYQPKKSSQPPGADAPVGGAINGTPASTDDEYTHEEIRKTPLHELVKRRLGY